MLKAHGLRKRYGDTLAVDGVSFEIAKGACFGLLGPNGAGKTTTIGMLVGVLDPDAGTIELDGKPAAVSTAAYKERIGYVPQEIALYDDLTADQNLRFFGMLYDLTGERLQQRIDAALDVANLRDRAKEPVRNFSGGMKRRLNIAVALLHDPDLIVLDEPTVGVDPQSRNAIFDALEALRAKGKTLLYTTHYMEEVERLCDRIAIMDHGKIVAAGSLGELQRSFTGKRRAVLELESDGTIALEAIQQANGVNLAELQGQRLTIDVESLEVALPEVLAVLAKYEIRYDALSSGKLSLESMFLQLTGRSLRD